MRFLFLPTMLTAAAIAVPAAAFADTVTVSSAPGTTTYSYSGGSGSAVAYNNAAYGSVAGGQFISVDSNGGPSGLVSYTDTFTLLAGETYTGSLSFLADDHGGVIINGVTVAPIDMGDIGEYMTPTTIALSSGDFVAGTNTFTLEDNNTGGPGGVDFSATLTGTATTAVTPEPSSFVLLGTGLLGAVGVARRRIFA